MEAMQNADDALIVEGYPVHEPRFKWITVYATQVTTKALHAAKRKEQVASVNEGQGASPAPGHLLRGWTGLVHESGSSKAIVWCSRFFFDGRGVGVAEHAGSPQALYVTVCDGG